MNFIYYCLKTLIRFILLCIIYIAFFICGDRNAYIEIDKYFIFHLLYEKYKLKILDDLNIWENNESLKLLNKMKNTATEWD